MSIELSTLGSVIKTAYEAELNTNAFTDAEKTKVANALLRDASVPLTADWDVGNFQIRAQTFQSDVVTGTAPFIVASTTVVTNLNADQLDGNEATAFALTGHDHSGVYEPADATILKDADIGSTVASQAHTHTGVYEPADATIVKDADIGVSVAAQVHTHTGVYEPADATILKDADIGSTVASAAQGALADTALQPADVLPAVWNIQTGVTYTVQASDAGKIIGLNNAASIAVTLPDGLGVNFQCTIIQLGVGVPTITPATDTINGAGTGVSPSAQWKAAYFSQFASTEWVAIL